MNIQQKLLDTFLYLISIDTASCENSSTFPSTSSQLHFAKILAKKCEEIGLEEISVDENGYVFATLKGTDITKSKIGFIAHMDTSPEFSGANIKPNIVKNYIGEDITLNSITLSKNEFPSLNDYIGKTLITTDGTTLLGADDKAGISEILTAFEYLKNNKNLKYGDLKLAFTPDEEVGNGTLHFDIEKFNCDFAYTIDGGKLGDLNYENFNAANVVIEIKGKNVHTGYATNVMINSSLVATELISMLPNKTPTNTKDYEGFFHLCDINGNIEKTTISLIIRDFDKQEFENKKQIIKDIVEKLNQKYNKVIKLVIKDTYYNMYDILKDKMHIVDKATEAMKKAGIEPKISGIRGGTDGARLSYKGLACPNIFTGGHNFHGPYEYICLESMAKAVEVIVNIATQ